MGTAKKFLCVVIALLCALLLFSCGKKAYSVNTKDSGESDAQTVTTDSAEDTQPDVWDESGSVHIAFSDGGAEIDRSGAAFAGGVLTVNTPGVYVLSGELEGSIFVSLGKNDSVQLVFNGLIVRSTGTAAVNIAGAGQAVVTLAPESENILSDSSDYAENKGDEPNACLFSKCDLTVNGTGSLSVTGNANNGIGTKDSLLIQNGNITVSAAKNALKGNDSVTVTGGNITVTSATDGIKSDKEDSPSKGFVDITGGNVDITCSDDGIQAVSRVAVSGCTVTVSAADKTVNCDGNVNIEDGCLTEK